MILRNPPNTTAVQGIPYNRIRILENEVAALQNAGAGSGFQLPVTGGLTGINIWTTAPNAIVVDGITYQKVNQDGTVNWTGTTTTVLSFTPTNSIFAVA